MLPLTLKGHAIIENVIEHAAMAIGADPLEFRMNNLDVEEEERASNEEGMAMKMIELAKARSKYDMRKQEIEAFNAVRY